MNVKVRNNMSPTKPPKIYGVSSEDRSKLEIIFNVSQAAVSYALSGNRASKKSLQIRHVAQTQMGGFIKLATKVKKEK